MRKNCLKPCRVTGRIDSTYGQIFTNIIDIGSSQLSAKEEKFIYKTSVDYTLCKKDGKPLLSIEFDGLGHGFSRNGEYVQLVSNKDKYRKLKLDLKLRIAREIGYHLFVISYDEKEPIGPDLNLTVVDGIIGKTLAQKHRQYLINNLPVDEELVSTLPEDKLHAYIEDLALDAECEAEFKWNPIKSLAVKYFGQAMKKRLFVSVGFYFPPGGLQKKNERGSVCFVDTALGRVWKEVWVRDTEGFGYYLAGCISELLALKEALDLYGKRGEP